MGQFFKENVFLYKIPNVTSSQLEFASDRPIGCRANYTVMQSAQKLYSFNFANIFVHMAPTSLEKCW